MAAKATKKATAKKAAVRRGTGIAASTEKKQTDRFYVQKSKHRLFQELSARETGPLEQMKDVFLLAAAVGYRKGLRRPLEDERQHVGFWHYFSEARDIPLLQCIAIAETKDVAVMGDRNTIVEIAQEYANGGIDLLAEMLHEDRDATLVSMATELLDMAADAVD
jgi:dnd system-associated protein 4